MFFTELGRFVAGVAFIIGAGAIAFGIKILLGTLGNDLPDIGYAIVAMFFWGGWACVLFSIILGVFTDISKSLAKGGIPTVTNAPRIEPIARESE